MPRPGSPARSAASAPPRRAPAAPATPARRAAGLTPAQLLIAAGVPVLAACFVYLPALGNGFIWDDPTVLLQMRAIQSVGDLLVPPPIIPKFYFRPFIFVTYLVDRAFGGETPFWFHASIIGWHALNTALVFALSWRLFPGEWLIASGGALLFAVFPTHVESVAWMAGRSDVIVCSFVLLTVLLAMRHDDAASAWLAGGTLLLATLSKEMAVACVLLVPVLDLLSLRRLLWLRYIPLLLATGLYFLLRNHALGAFVGGMPSAATPAQLGVDIVRAIGFYLARALVPLPLCAYIPTVPDAPLYFFLGLLGPLCVVAFVAAALRRRRWQPAFLVAWFCLTLAPSLTVIIRRSASAVVAERYLYVPTVASCLLIAWAIVRLGEQRRLRPQPLAAVFGVLAIACAVEVMPYTRVWTDNFTFWSDVAAKVPDDALPQREVATALQDRGRLDEAEQALQRALAAPASPESRAATYSNLSNLYRRMQRYDDAERAIDAAIKMGPHPAFQHTLGMTLMAKIEQEQRQGDQAAVVRDLRKARDAFEEALRLGNAPGAANMYVEWNAAKTHALLGQVLFSLNDRSGAREHLEAALKLQPTGAVADVTRQYMQKLER